MLIMDEKVGYPKLKIGLKDIAGLVNSALSKICRMELAQSAFSCTGIYPLNPNVFDDLDFNASLCEPSKTLCQTSSNEDEADPSLIPISISPGTSNLAVHQPKFLPSTSIPATDEAHSSPQIQVEQLNSRPSTSQAILEKISPLPSNVSAKFNTRKRRGDKSDILTSTPYKVQLEEKRRHSKDKEKRVNKNKDKKLKKAVNRPTVKKALMFEEDNRPKQDDEETNCIICGESFDEDWIQCNNCKGWPHENCANLEGDGLFYTCDVCRFKMNN